MKRAMLLFSIFLLASWMVSTPVHANTFNLQKNKYQITPVQHFGQPCNDCGATCPPVHDYDLIGPGESCAPCPIPVVPKECCDPCAPACGIMCGVSVTSIAITVAIVVGVAAIILSSGEGKAGHN